ncbi:MAG: type I phosphomannose isomerase catalytic subunit [Elusimicrobiota bacterium]
MKKQLPPLLLHHDHLTRNLWGWESWEFSVHPKCPSFVKIEGRKYFLNQLPPVLKKELFGTVRNFFLVKIIDSKKPLSVQVHPDQSYARRYEKQNGKTESWYILKARPGKKWGGLFMGFHSDPKNKKEFFNLIANANNQGVIHQEKKRDEWARKILKHSSHVFPKSGDVYHLNPGSLHAIGAGMRLVEIQQSSDITYRLWDWNRSAHFPVNEKPKLRELHLEKGKAVLATSQRFVSDFRLEGITKEPFEKIYFESPKAGYGFSEVVLDRSKMVNLNKKGQFSVLTVIAGDLKISWGEKKSLVVPSFQSVLIPACLKQCQLQPGKRSVKLIRSFPA